MVNYWRIDEKVYVEIGEKVREFESFLDESEKMISADAKQLQLSIYTKA